MREPSLRIGISYSVGRLIAFHTTVRKHANVFQWSMLRKHV
jgi:hypothetical protein